MKIYLDKNFCCYVEESSFTVQSADVSYFDNKCKAFIEGYRYIPEGQFWTRPDGIILQGEMITPYKDFAILESVQKLYEESTIIQADIDSMLVDYEYRLTLLELGID